MVSDAPSSVCSQRIIIVTNQLPLRAHKSLEGKGWSFSWDDFHFSEFKKGVVHVETQGICTGHTLMDMGLKMEFKQSLDWSSTC